jgi:hypothetical protein
MCWLIVPRVIHQRALGSNSEAFDLSLFLMGALGQPSGALITRWRANRDLKICRPWTDWYNLAIGLAFGLGAFFVVTLVAPVGSAGNGARLRSAVVVPFALGSIIDYSTFLGGPSP